MGIFRNWRNRAIILIGFIAAFRAVLMGRTGLGDAEAYYWTWSQQLDWSYYDHPPMTAWLIRLFTDLGGSSVFVTRLPALLLFLASCYLLYKITVKLYSSERAGFWALVFFNLSPIFAVGTLQIVPDLPVVFFWLLFIHLIVQVLEYNRVWLWYVIGIILGLGLLSKYMAILLPVSTLLLLLWHEKYRIHLRQIHVYLSALLGFVLFSPVIIWNYVNNFTSFSFHLQQRHDTSRAFDPDFALLSLGGQILYYSPIMWVISIYIAYTLIHKVLANKDNSLASIIPFWFGVPPLIFFMAITFWTTDSEPHWTALGFLTLFIAWGWHYTQAGKLFQRTSLAGIGISIIVISIFYVQMLTPIIPFSNAKYDITNVLYGWDQAEIVIVEEYHKLDGDEKFVLAHHYLIGGQLAFNLHEKLPVYVVSQMTNQFDYFNNNTPSKGANFIFVTESQFLQPPENYFLFDRCEAPRELSIYRGEKFAREFHIYPCYNYQGKR